MSQRSPFLVKDWLVEPSLLRMSRGNEVVRLEPRTLAVLQVLAARTGEALTRDELLDEIWEDAVVTDHVLTQSISELRRLLGDDTKNPTYIETIPRVGYRMIASVALPGDSAQPENTSPLHLVLTPQTDAVAHSQTSRRSSLVVFLGVLLIAASLPFLARLTVEPAGNKPAEVIPVSSLPGIEATPALSPDGRFIAYTWAEDAESSLYLYVKQIGTEQARRLTNVTMSELNPVWSPDGGRLAFIRYDQHNCDIYTISILGTTERRIAPCGGTINRIHWSPDGSKLAAAIRTDAGVPFRIFLIPLDTGRMTALSDPPAHIEGDFHPAFSPDGRSLMFQRRISRDVTDLYRIDLEESGPPKRVTHDAVHIAGYDWTPDGEHLILASSRGGHPGMWRISRSGNVDGPLRNLRARQPTSPSLDRSGGRMVFSDWTVDMNIWRASIADADGTDSGAPVAASNMRESSPHVAGPERNLVFVSDRTGHPHVWLSDGIGNEPIQLTRDVFDRVRSPRLSPDGERILFEGVRDGITDLYVVDANGGETRSITDDPHDNRYPEWTPDMASMYYSSNRSGRWEIYRRTIASGLDTQVTFDGGTMPRLSPDGDAMFYVRKGEPSILRMDLATGRRRVVVTLDQMWEPHNWAVGAESVYFLEGLYSEKGSRGGGIYRINLTSGKRTLLVTQPVTFADSAPGLAVDPTESWLYFGRIDHADSDLRLAANF